VLAYEPHFKLVRPKHLAHNKIVRTIITKLGSPTCQFSAFANDDLVSIEQARQLNRDLFPTASRTLDLRGFGDIRSRGQADTSQKLNPFSD
jgi:hypothetical protein